jgi:predicted enzyme related to lactoylglutathione lyase
MLVNIDVDDLERGVRFYTEAFGLTAGRRFGGAAVELLGAEAPIYLLLKSPQKPPFPGASGERDYGRHWTPVHLDFVVEDLAAAVARAEAAGARREGDVEEHAWGHIAYGADPWGHGFCLLVFKPGGYDLVTTGP